MTREEEIRQAADKYVDNFGCKKKDTPVLSSYYLGYVAGAEWADAHQLSPWVSVAERLPEGDMLCEWVAVKLKGINGWCKGYWSGEIWHYMNVFGCEMKTFDVTHWMPIHELNN